MLGKLFKHDMKACSKLLLPLYFVLLVLTIMDRIVLRLSIFKGSLAIIPGFITFIYIVAIIVIVITSFILIIFRFYNNLVTDEGYLMFTLPVKSHQLINSKLFSSVIWSMTSIMAVITSIFIVFMSGAKMQVFINGFQQQLKDFHIEFGNYSTLFIVEIILLVFLFLFYNILLIYMSIAAGQLFNGHKVIGAFVSYAAISVAVQITLILFSLLATFIINKELSNTSIVLILLPLVFVIFFMFCLLYYFVTKYIFQRKLNLE